MRKLVLSLALVAIATTAANAQLDLFYDVRANIADIDSPQPPYIYSASLGYYFPDSGQEYPLQNGGGRGDGARIYLHPRIGDVGGYYGYDAPDGMLDDHSFFNPDYDWTSGDFYLYGKYVGPTDYMLSSVGVTQEIPAAAFTSGGDFYLESATTTVQSGTLWDGYNFTGSNASTKIKAVQVPVNSTPAYDTTAGMLGTAGATAQLAKIHVQSAFPNGATTVGIYELKLKVNELLCTQVTRPPATAPALTIRFGYAGGSPEACTGSGSVENATSTTADMVITVVRKGDFDFNGTPGEFMDDTTYYSIQPDSSIANPVETWLADFDGNGVACEFLDDVDYYRQVWLPLP